MYIYHSSFLFRLITAIPFCKKNNNFSTYVVHYIAKNNNVVDLFCLAIVDFRVVIRKYVGHARRESHFQ